MPRERSPSRRCLFIACVCGVLPESPGAARGHARAAGRLAGVLRRHLAPGVVVLVQGPSGAGKSSVLEALAHACPGAVRVGRGPRGGRAVADCSADPLDRWLGTLSAAGLAEARLWLRRAAALSSGQRARLALALAMAHAERALERSGPGARPGPVLVADELGDGLDTPTRASVAVSLARWARRRRIAVVAAGSAEDLGRWLRPDVRLALALHPGGLAAEAARVGADHAPARRAGERAA